MKVLWFDIILLIGLFYAFFPHSIHLTVASAVGYDKPISHGVHVSFGFTMLLVWLYFSKDRIEPRLHTALTIALLAGLLDSIFHFIYTTPFETWFYFVVKIALLIPISYYLLGYKNVDKYPIYYASIGALIFMITFSIYYRINEYVREKPFGSRVPDIKIFEKNIIYSDNMITSTIIWGIAHFFAYFIPASILL
jgi:hypothetical protein